MTEVIRLLRNEIFLIFNEVSFSHSMVCFLKSKQKYKYTSTNVCRKTRKTWRPKEALNLILLEVLIPIKNTER